MVGERDVREVRQRVANCRHLPVKHPDNAGLSGVEHNVVELVITVDDAVLVLQFKHHCFILPVKNKKARQARDQKQEKQAALTFGRWDENHLRSSSMWGNGSTLSGLSWALWRVMNVAQVLSQNFHIPFDLPGGDLHPADLALVESTSFAKRLKTSLLEVNFVEAGEGARSIKVTERMFIRKKKEKKKKLLLTKSSCHWE